jgi:quinol monooxygenase YgiN
MNENTMPEPFIYVSTWKIKEGKLDDFKRFTGEFVEIIKAKEPQLIAFNVFLNEDGTEMTSIQVHTDAASMDFHLQVVNKVLGEEMLDWIERADFVEPKQFEIYGTPSAALLEADRPLVESGVVQSIKPLFIAGFTHSTPG